MQCKVPIKLYANKKSCGGVHNIFEVVHSYLKKTVFGFSILLTPRTKGLKSLLISVRDFPFST